MDKIIQKETSSTSFKLTRADALPMLKDAIRFLAAVGVSFAVGVALKPVLGALAAGIVAYAVFSLLACLNYGAKNHATKKVFDTLKNQGEDGIQIDSSRPIDRLHLEVQDVVNRYEPITMYGHTTSKKDLERYLLDLSRQDLASFLQGQRPRDSIEQDNIEAAPVAAPVAEPVENNWYNDMFKEELQGLIDLSVVKVEGELNETEAVAALVAAPVTKDWHASTFQNELQELIDPSEVNVQDALNEAEATSTQ